MTLTALSSQRHRDVASPDDETGNTGSPADCTVSSQDHPRLAAGTMLGTYRVERLIGAGGMGEVYVEPLPTEPGGWWRVTPQCLAQIYGPARFCARLAEGDSVHVARRIPELFQQCDALNPLDSLKNLGPGTKQRLCRA